MDNLYETIVNGSNFSSNLVEIDDLDKVIRIGVSKQKQSDDTLFHASFSVSKSLDLEIYIEITFKSLRLKTQVEKHLITCIRKNTDSHVLCERLLVCLKNEKKQLLDEKITRMNSDILEMQQYITELESKIYCTEKQVPEINLSIQKLQQSIETEKHLILNTVDNKINDILATLHNYDVHTLQKFLLDQFTLEKQAVYDIIGELQNSATQLVCELQAKFEQDNENTSTQIANIQYDLTQLDQKTLLLHEKLESCSNMCSTALLQKQNPSPLKRFRDFIFPTSDDSSDSSETTLKKAKLDLLKTQRIYSS
jgi:hypothetical protein